MKKWKDLPWYDECEHCDSPLLKAYTSCQEEGMLESGDKIKCEYCDKEAVFEVSEEPYGYIDWDIDEYEY